MSSDYVPVDLVPESFGSLDMHEECDRFKEERQPESNATVANPEMWSVAYLYHRLARLEAKVQEMSSATRVQRSDTSSIL